MKPQIAMSSYRAHTMTRALRELDLIAKPVIVEVGRTRNLKGWEDDGYSTIHFSDYVCKHRGSFVSIECDASTEHICTGIMYWLRIDLSRTHFVNVAPDRFHIPEMDIDLLYLDGPDCDKGMEIASAVWHFKCMEFLEPQIVAGGLVLVDDCMNEKVPVGKGALVVPYLQQVCGYDTLERGYQWLLKKPNKKEVS